MAKSGASKGAKKINAFRDRDFSGAEPKIASAKLKEYWSSTDTTPADWGIKDTSAYSSGMGSRIDVKNIGKKGKGKI